MGRPGVYRVGSRMLSCSLHDEVKVLRFLERKEGSEGTFLTPFYIFFLLHLYSTELRLFEVLRHAPINIESHLNTPALTRMVMRHCFK